MSLLQAFGQFAGQAAAVPTSALTLITRATNTGDATISIDNCFTSNYDNYRIFLYGTVASSIRFINYRYRVSGSDNTTANSYSSRTWFSTGATTSSGLTTATEGEISLFNAAQRNMSVMDVFSPALAKPTASWSRWFDTTDGGRAGRYAQIHNQSVAYDGITFFAAVNLDVTISIYGFAKGV